MHETVWGWEDLVVWGAAQDLTIVFGFTDVTMSFLALVNPTTVPLIVLAIGPS